MKISYVSAIAVLALALAGAAPAFAATAATKAPTQDQATSDNGMKDLGIDISQAGSTPESVKTFIAALAPDARKGVEGGCVSALASTGTIAPTVLAFCKNAKM